MNKWRVIVSLVVTLLIVASCAAAIYIAIQNAEMSQPSVNDTEISTATFAAVNPTLLIDGPRVCAKGERLDGKSNQCKRVLA
jgi:hypothetical protein